MAAKTQISHAFIRITVVKNVSFYFIGYTTHYCQWDRHVCSGAYLIIIFFGNEAGNGHKSALVFGFNIKPIHSAVDLGNQSAAACEFFCIVCERLTISLVQVKASQVA